VYCRTKVRCRPGGRRSTPHRRPRRPLRILATGLDVAPVGVMFTRSSAHPNGPVRSSGVEMIDEDNTTGCEQPGIPREGAAQFLADRSKS
jgi:hypothetical protein